jgi:hypothetical protein
MRKAEEPNDPMNSKAQSRVGAINRELERLKRGRNPSATDNRARFALYRELIHLFEDAVAAANLQQESLGSRLRSWEAPIREALAALGGSAEPGATSLRKYDSEIHGPYLGVSDEGKAARQFREAILASPKAQVLGPQTPLVLGAALDAERLAAVGEVAVSPG